MKNAQPLVSIIVPVYNVEKYLDQCISSLVTQTYENLEIILIDDGSTDECPAKCDLWGSKDDRIQVVHKKNGGLSSARNTGMKCMKGEYCCFIDSDDYVEDRFVEHLVNDAILTGADIIAGGYVRALNNKKIEVKVNQADNVLVCIAPEGIFKIFQSGVAAWGKLYSTKIVQDIEFPEGWLAEDNVFQVRTATRANKIAFTKYCDYIYRIRKDSISKGKSAKYEFHYLKQLIDSYELAQSSFPELSECIMRRIANAMYGLNMSSSFARKEKIEFQAVLEAAYEIVSDDILNCMENPLDEIPFLYEKYYEDMSIKERKKIQKDYRKCTTHRLRSKYILCYISLNMFRWIQIKRGLIT